jgi:hypothetical protein
MNHNVLLCTIMYHYVPLCNIMYHYVPLCTTMYHYVPPCTIMHCVPNAFPQRFLFRTAVTLTMPYPTPQHVAVPHTHKLFCLTQYNCVLTDTNSLQYDRQTDRQTVTVTPQRYITRTRAISDDMCRQDTCHHTCHNI